MRFVKIGVAAEFLGTSVATMRKWERTGELVSDRKTKGGTRYYDMDKLAGMQTGDAPTIAYARVSSHDQKDDLERQAALLSAFCTARGWKHEVIKDLGSGMNYRKEGLNQLLDMILHRQMKRLVLSHKDRLLRFGAELVFALCETQQIEVVIINQGEQPGFEQELVADVLEIITVFSARMYGARSHKAKKLIDSFSEAAKT